MKYHQSVAVGLFIAVSGLSCTRGSDDPERNVALAPEIANDDSHHDGDPQHPLEPSILDVAFLPDCKRVLTLCEAGVILWDIQTSTVIRVMEGSQGWFARLNVSADGKWVLAGTVLWEIETGRRLRQFASDRKWVVECEALSPDKRYILRGGRLVRGSPENASPARGLIEVWDAMTGQLQRVLDAHKLAVFSVAISRDGRFGASFGCDADVYPSVSCNNEVRLWDLQTGELIQTHETGYSGKVCFSLDGKWLYSLGKSSLRTRDVNTGALVQSIDTFGKARQPPWAFSEDMRFYVTQEGADQSPPDGTLTLWELHSGKSVQVFDRSNHHKHIYKVKISPNSKLLAVCGDDQLFQVWDMKTGNMVMKNVRVPWEIRNPPRVPANRDRA